MDTSTKLAKSAIKKLMEESERIELDKTKHRPFIIGQYSTFKIFWDIMISVIASFDSLTVPFLFSFTQQTREFSDSPGWQWTGRFIDFIYIVDIIFAFRTTYVDVVTGDEITQPSLLAKKYMSGSALIDFISAITVLANL